jgi:hypothetical protein
MIPALKRSRCPTRNTVPTSSALATSFSASSTVGATGFSMSMCFPASRYGKPTSQWQLVGTAMETASTPSMRA